MSSSEVVGCLDFLHEPTMSRPRKTQTGLPHLTRPVHKNTFARFSDNLLVDSLLNKEEQHDNNSWQMLFLLPFRVFQPSQKHMQKLICLLLPSDSKQRCSDTTGQSGPTGYFYITQTHMNHKWQKSIQKNYWYLYLQNTLLPSDTCIKFLEFKCRIWAWCSITLAK